MVEHRSLAGWVNAGQPPGRRLDRARMKAALESGRKLEGPGLEILDQLMPMPMPMTMDQTRP